MRKFGLIGKTLGHSFSKQFFEEKFSAEAIAATFENIELATISEVKTVLTTGFSGLSVTVPYKTAIIPFLDELSVEAQAIGAVNSIGFENGKAIGYNTDAHGFHQSIKPFLTNQHERALIIGTGGAAKAVAYVLQQIGLNVVFVARNPQGENEFPFEALNEHMVHACKLIVHCTPVGTFPNNSECIPFPFASLSKEHLCVDLIYNPAETSFLAQSKAAGATILNGYSMLQEQAIKSWSIWNKS
jgi:shikimate dehydrogenase